MRLFPRSLRFWTALVVLCWWCALQVAPAAAGLAPSRSSGETRIASSRDADLVIVERALENKIVAQKLRDYGVAPADVQLKLASVSDRDLHTLASASKGLPSGGDDALGVIVTLLVIVILVLVILKLMNKKVVVR
ncbi:MAG: PA2779 family protein [Candidatus Eisenbacteria bacterium]|nr:PA2779 family protein [Candidatus Eisenbacteria bacterium]